MKISIQPIGDKNALRRLYEQSKRGIESSLNEIGRGAKKDFNDYVAEWKHKPRFEVRRTKYTVAVVAAGENAKIFQYVDQGTRWHPIRAKMRHGKRGLLKFRTGYQPRTRPNNLRYRGSGKAIGDWRSVKQVRRHPGTKARHASRIIARRWQKEGRAIMREKLRMKRLPK